MMMIPVVAKGLLSAVASSSAQLRVVLLAPVWMLLVIITSSCVAAATSGDGDRITIIKYRTEDYAAAATSVVFQPLVPAPLPAPTAAGSLSFGTGVVYNSPIYIKGIQVGHAAGLFFYDSVADASTVYDTHTIAFTKGKWAGSTLVFAGNFVGSSLMTTVAVTGGTGVFQFAAGSAKYVSLSPTTYDVTITLKGVLKKALA